MNQQPISLVPIDTTAAGWDIVMQSNAQKINAYFKTFLFTITLQGDTSTPSEITIQLQSGDATPVDVLEQFKLRVRIVDDSTDTPTFPDATNATISSVITGTTLETFTANIDLLIESDANGLIKLQLTDATAEKFWLIIGESYLDPTPASYQANLQVEHTV